MPVFASSRGIMTNQPIALADKMTTDFKRSEIFRSDRDKGDERDHQAVAVTHGVILADRSTGYGVALVHQLLPKLKELDAGNDGPGWSSAGAARCSRALTALSQVQSCSGIITRAALYTAST